MNEYNIYRKRSLTPLWVISFFVSLTETVLSIGVIKTDGTIQLALTLFVIIFPIFIASVFFLILWNRPYVFYSPTEYGQQNVRQYVEAMQLRVINNNQLFSHIEDTIRTKLSDSEIINKISNIISHNDIKNDSDKIAQALTSVADKTLETIRRDNFITIDSRPLLGKNGKIWQIAYSQYSMVSDLLDMIWSFLDKYGIPPYTYGVLWALREKESGKIFKEMGRTWASSFGSVLDFRNLSEVGISPGILLEVISLSKKKTSHWD